MSVAATQIMVLVIVLSLILLFMGIGLLVIVHICIVGRAFRRGLIGNVTIIETNHQRSIGNTSMSKDDLEKLPCYEYITKDSSTSSSPVDCAVCLESFKMGEKCRMLPLCKHSFHAQCVDEWLLQTPICPICRGCADSRRIEGSILDEEMSHFSTDTSLDNLRASQTTESSSNFSIDISLDSLRDSQRIESGHFRDVRIHIGENQDTESHHCNDINNGLREIQSLESDYVVEMGLDSNPTD